MTEAEAAAMQARVLEIAAGFEALIRRLQDVHDAVPISPLEPVMLLGEEDMDIATTLRSMIECVLADRLEPALRELRQGSAYKKPDKVRE
ncbi:MAG: hypothetical protein JF614_08260 [Acidobacteria bacterium]|nr:hypothetical protein [Acidobacteriota bacterium]